MLSVQDVEKFLENRTDEEVCLVKSHADCKLRGIRAGLGHLPGEGFTGLYAIETSAGITKIGRTKNLRQRCVNLRTIIKQRNYGAITQVHFIPVQDRTWHHEQELFSIFDTKRVDGEWFDLSASDLASISNMGQTFGGQSS
jgi:hypothetical protein